MKQGYLAIILHAHLPYLGHAEYDDSLEENWLYEAISEAYMPILFVLEGLAEEGIDFRLTLSITPTLASMLSDPLLQSRYLDRLDLLIDLGKKEILRTRSHPEFQALARRYHRRFVKLRDAYLNRYDRNLLQAFKQLEESGRIEIMASAATHGYLPLLCANESAVRAQIDVGIEYHRRTFGRRPEGFWLPECGYDPGVDELLKEKGIRYVVLETHGITRSESRPRYGVYAPVYCPSGVAAFARDADCSRQVWSSVEGYPGDYDYREFYRDIAYDLDLDYIGPYVHRGGIRLDTGFKYFRITGKEGHKEVYVPEWAERKAEIHAEHFILERRRQIKQLDSLMDRNPIVVAPYDAELFGHWWFEGPKWLNYLMRKVHKKQEMVRLVTLSEYLEQYSVNQASTPSVSSWGRNGFHETWLNVRNDWVYRHLHEAASSMEKLAGRHPRAKGLMLDALKQAARELLLAQASDWTFMMDKGDMTEYATKRIRTHLLRLGRLKEQIESRSIDPAWLSTVENQDRIFPHIDYRCFRVEGH
jgi:1,4-alpha-glucan branching enzyme